MKKFFDEFKKFITRGNVLDMSVGVIVGSAFTGIVNGLTDFILKPLVNWLIALCLGKEGLSGAITMLSPSFIEGTNEIDLSTSIYIDWGAFISAIINFAIIAFVLFTIVKLINSFRDEQKKISDRIIDGIPTIAERKQMKKEGVKLSDRNQVRAWMENKAKEEKEREEQLKKEAEEKAKQEREENPTTEDLLKDIRDLLKEKKN